MGYSMTPIPFFAIDDSPIEIESASSAKFFNAKTLEELERMCKGGGFYETDKANKAYYWKDKDGNFVEFTFKKEAMTIEINKGGFGIASLFSKDSTKEVLIEQSNLRGCYLDELNIEYKIGDEFELRSPVKNGSGFFVHKVKVYEITNEKYLCEFMNQLKEVA